MTGPFAAPAAAPRIWDVEAQRFIDERQLVDRLATARFRLLGEVHDNAQQHLVRARLIGQIAATGARAAVVFEQFDLDHDRALVAAQARAADAELLADAGKLDRKSWRWPLHKPLIDAALAAKLPIRAANLPRAELMRLARRGVGELPIAPWRARFLAAQWGEREESALHADIIESHCNLLPESMVPSLVLAQRLRDAAMAQALVVAAPGDGAILIAGNGHVRNDLAVPLYLHAFGLPDADARSLSVGFIEVTPEDARSDDFPRNVIAAHPGFDFIWFTPPAERPDRCEELKKPGARSVPGS